MKHWLETRAVLDRLAELRKIGKVAALATVVRVRGSAYRHEGAKMLVAEDGSITGNVSGGCLEADVREVALGVLRTGTPELRSYCGGPDEGRGVGPRGRVRGAGRGTGRGCRDPRTAEWNLLDGTVPFASCVLLENPVSRLVITADGTEGSLGDPALDVAGSRIARSELGIGAPGIRRIRGRDVFIDLLVPPPQLVIVGAGEDARPLVRFTAEIGFRVIAVDERPALLTPERFPSAAERIVTRPEHLTSRVAFVHETYAVVMTHHYARDREFLRALLDTDAVYICILGPRSRTDRMLAELSAAVRVDERRIYGPIGLDIGTDGAEQVALSALSEILAVRSGRTPASLRDRRAAIHAPSQVTHVGD